MTLTDWMLKKNRKYVIEQIKAPLLRAIIKYCHRYPEPTHENCRHMNSHEFLNIWDEFMTRQLNPERRDLFMALRRCFIAEYEHDETYTRWMDWFMIKITEAVNDRRIKLTPPDEHTVYWNNAQEV